MATLCRWRRPPGSPTIPASCRCPPPPPPADGAASTTARSWLRRWPTACLAVAPVLARPRSRDQRALARRDRLANMEGRFIPLPGASAFPSVILVDDVYTTGATLFAATDAVRVAGAATVRCLTFARVW
ncbi:MAG: ComF family protein [Eggerthella lenta]